jgi:hypothetical protein
MATFKLTRDEVQQAIQADSPNVVYLNPESEYLPIGNEQGVAALKLEQDQDTETDEFDSRPRLTDLLLGTDRHYSNAVASSDEAQFF